jgi:hypothetical protein
VFQDGVVFRLRTRPFLLSVSQITPFDCRLLALTGGVGYS